jgi:hypothetical protein
VTASESTREAGRIDWPYKVHDLKTCQPYFDAVRTEAKTFEVRKDDRDFQPGDLLVLREWLTHNGGFYGVSQPLLRQVTYVLRDGEKFGVAAGTVVLGIRPVRVELIP